VAGFSEPVVRIISDTPTLAEARINELAGTYSPVVWGINPVGNGIMVTVVMVRTDQMPRQTIAMPVSQILKGMGR
jgi:hypothetical protein